MKDLNLNATLTQRINPTVQFPANLQNSFVLYLPTVNLRFKHNPAFALACHLANQHEVPLLVLAVVLDDAHLPTTLSKNTNDLDIKRRVIVVSTARRTAFVLEALQQATREWQEHGAGVAIRVHGPECRTPHHLTLARQSVAVVVDEPFVHPYLSMVQSVERAARQSQVPVLRVDGSTTVAPVSMLQRIVDKDGSVTFSGVPNKAWMWEKKTEPKRRSQVLGVVQDGHFDSPALVKGLPMNFFLDEGTVGTLKLPSSWANPETPSPGKRPWTAMELSAISDLKSWVLDKPGIDASVPPCSQTHGSTSSGQQRWNRFRQAHLSNYAKLRNNISKPHAVSRMSCYLNYGCVSIFQIVFDLWQSRSGGATKFADEIIKWREIDMHPLRILTITTSQWQSHSGLGRIFPNSMAWSQHIRSSNSNHVRPTTILGMRCRIISTLPESCTTMHA
ncbi:FAD binding domain of DNA photolyase [Fragilaria crotonensis]|nr:FAD binding domain of DNA photolyase [Fragilaria crotonensis]